MLAKPNAPSTTPTSASIEEAAVIDLPAVQQEIDDLESQLAAVRTEMRGHLKKLGLAPK